MCKKIKELNTYSERFNPYITNEEYYKNSREVIFGIVGQFVWLSVIYIRMICLPTVNRFYANWSRCSFDVAKWMYEKKIAFMLI